MGTGKSASAIMAKEILGAKQALVVVPSNVIDTWTGYLSDQIGDDGEQVGYFKSGRAPSVLVVDSLQGLQDVNPADYEYVVISQERLNDAYVEALGEFNYDMLIVDEMHKLKNISSGKRAESLVALSERIQDEGNYLVLLSGTPVPNKVSDVAITLKLLYPDQFGDVDDKALVSQILSGDLLNLRSLLVPRMQMKSLAETVEMPEHEEIIRTFPLSEKEREIYEILVDEDELTATEKLAILRQCVLNPRFLDATPDVTSSKIRTVSEDLHQTFTDKDKVVMFVNNYVNGVIRGDGTILNELALPDGVEVLTIDGSVDKQTRLEIQQRLNQGSGKVLLLVSGQTADVGVNFSGAEEVYIYNEPWTMYDKRQQIARVYRPGLKAPLKTRTYIAADTIEQGIHQYIDSKYRAVEKLLRGVPISEIETEMLRQTEKSSGADVEVNPELAEYYFSSWDKMMRIYGHVKEIGEGDFKDFLSKYDEVYAESYANVVGSRSYQANVSRMAASLIRSLAEADKKRPETVTVLDVASGPEMLKKHAPNDLASRIVSIDINDKHFTPGSNGKRVVGSFVNLPVADKSVDYVNLSLGLHYTSYSPRRGNYERIKVLQEVNRVLPVGGQGVVSMIYSMDLPEDSDFRDAMNKLGFMVVSSYSGEVTHGKNFRTQLITLKKVRDCDLDTRTIVSELGTQGLQSLKMKKTKVSLSNARGVLTSFPVSDATVINAVLNDSDQAVLNEEGAVTQEMETLKQQYGTIENIPREIVQRSGLSRIFNGKRYVLFRRLQSDASAVVIK
jgi:ubiquinone/menaquinone biosynthesis C-methylase UbiE